MLLLTSLSVRQRPGHKVKISACLMSSQDGYAILSSDLKGGAGAKIDLFMPFCAWVIFSLTIHKGYVNFSIAEYQSQAAHKCFHGQRHDGCFNHGMASVCVINLTKAGALTSHLLL